MNEISQESPDRQPGRIARRVGAGKDLARNTVVDFEDDALDDDGFDLRSILQVLLARWPWVLAAGAAGAATGGAGGAGSWERAGALVSARERRIAARIGAPESVRWTLASLPRAIVRGYGAGWRPADARVLPNLQTVDHFVCFTQNYSVDRL